MVILVVLFAFFALLGLASLAGLTTDSRDPDYGLGHIIGAPHPDAKARVSSGRRGPRSSADRATAF